MSRAHPATIKFHQSLIRLAKGMITAWEVWLKDRHLDSSGPENS